MKIQERSFAGKTFRPKPAHYISSNKKLIAVITPWGQEAINSQAVFENLETQYNLFAGDKESTHPFPKKLSLTPIENDMRTAVIQTNEKIFNDINQDEYSMGFELFFAVLIENILTVIQIGQPLILIDNPHQALQPIGQTIAPTLETPAKTSLEIPTNTPLETSANPANLTTETSANPANPPPTETSANPANPPPTETSANPANPATKNLQKKNKSSAPLPYQLLGIHEDISFHPFFFRLDPLDRLIFLSRSTIPAKWFTLSREERTLNNLSKHSAEENPHTPFWLALLDPKPE